MTPEEIAAVLRGSGLSDEPAEFDSDIHSWRCRYPDIYGPCDCFQSLVADLAALMDVPESEYEEGALAYATEQKTRAEKAEAQLITARDALAAIEAYAEAERVRANQAETALGDSQEAVKNLAEQALRLLAEPRRVARADDGDGA